MTDVFISYKREERDKVVLIADRLRSLGLDVWFDARLTTGHHFDREIDDHVRRARCVLVCWSEGALASEWVRAEAAIGRERNVLVPLLVEPCSPPVPFNTLQTENLIGWAGEADHDGWLRAITQIAGLVERPELAQEQRNRGQAERDLRRTQALLEAQKREEEDAQRRAAAAAGKRAELEAQLVNLGGVSAIAGAPAAAAPVSTAPKARNVQGRILSVASILGLAIIAVALTAVLYQASYHNFTGTLRAVLGATAGVGIATWIRATYDMRRISFDAQHFIVQYILVALSTCLAITFLLIVRSGWSAWRDFAETYDRPLRVLVFPVALALGLLLRSLAPILGRHRFDPAPAVSPLMRRIQQILWYGIILAPILFVTGSVLLGPSWLVGVIALASAGIGVALSTWLRSIRDARRLNMNLRSLLFELLLATIAMAIAVSLINNFSDGWSVQIWAVACGFVLGATLRFVLPNDGPLKDGSVRTSKAAVPWAVGMVALAAVAGAATFNLIVPQYGTEEAMPVPEAVATTCPPPEDSCPEGSSGYDPWGCQCGLSSDAASEPAEAAPPATPP